MNREVKLSSADRVLYPESGITKGDIFDYYGRIGPVLVPHLRDRPFTMKRYPHGIYEEVFFQKQAPRGIPDWIPTRQFRTQPRAGEARLVDFALLNSREAILWMVQQNCIDMNAWYSRVDKPARPDFVLFDLDPPDGEFRLGVRAAHLVREALDELELRSYVKTSGSEGSTCSCRSPGATASRRHTPSPSSSKRLAAENPGVITTEWLKRKRVGVLIDYHQNGAGKTIASAYSVRPKEGAPVSTPLSWEELTSRLDPGKFTMEAVLRRVEKEGDLFEPVLKGGQSLGSALRRLSRREQDADLPNSARASCCPGTRAAAARGARRRSCRLRDPVGSEGWRSSRR